MRTIIVAFAALLCCCALAGSVRAQIAGSGDDKSDYRLTQMLKSSFLTMACELPSIQPKVTNLHRSWTPATDDLLTRFFGGRDKLLSDEAVISPLWGKGRRYKSGMVLYVAPEDQVGGQVHLNQLTGIEVVPTFLDVYPIGFVYANNVPHKAVYATDVKVLSEIKADVTYKDLYDEKEGLSAAEALLSNMFGPLQVPAGFQSSVQTLIQHFGERLFVYRVVPEYVTEYNEYETSYVVETPDSKPEAEPQPKIRATHKVAVPVLDVYAHVMLDGDKMLCGMEYFWDNNITVAGQPQECIHAGQALIDAREKLFEVYKEQPPLITITAVKLAFIQDRNSTNTLVPAWLFDGWYQDYVEPKAPNPQTGTANPDIVNVPLPFAINALTGDLIML